MAIEILSFEEVEEATRTFGPYIINIEGSHAIIRRADGKTADPTFYEMQHMKCLAFGGPAWAVEVFPAAKELVDGQNQRHLWRVERGDVPNLRD